MGYRPSSERRKLPISHNTLTCYSRVSTSSSTTDIHPSPSQASSPNCCRSLWAGFGLLSFLGGRFSACLSIRVHSQSRSMSVGLPNVENDPHLSSGHHHDHGIRWCLQRVRNRHYRCSTVLLRPELELDLYVYPVRKISILAKSCQITG